MRTTTSTDRGARGAASPVTFALTLPWPPSVNHYWANRVIPAKHGPRRFIVMTYLADAGREYRVRVSEAIMAQRIPRRVLTGRLAIKVLAHPPDWRTRDLDNLWKGLLDSLKHADVIEDDGHFDDLRIRRGKVMPGGKVMVDLSEIPGEPMKSGDLLKQGSL